MISAPLLHLSHATVDDISLVDHVRRSYHCRWASLLLSHGRCRPCYQAALDSSSAESVVPKPLFRFGVISGRCSESHQGFNVVLSPLRISKF